MSDFFNRYFNVKNIIQGKREYRRQMQRLHALPEDYQYLYQKIQKHMWGFAAGDGYDMLELQIDLLELFEQGAAEGKRPLEITGEDVAAFCNGLLQNAKTYTSARCEKLNRDVAKRFKTSRE